MKSRAIAITAIASTAVIGLGACSSSTTTSNSPAPSDSSAPTADLNTMNANGVTYKYPKSWSERTDISTQAQQGNRVRQPVESLMPRLWAPKAQSR